MPWLLHEVFGWNFPQNASEGTLVLAVGALTAVFAGGLFGRLRG
jgi:hypothetical protein